MIVLNLTGSIAMGKTTAATQLRALGVSVYDADQAVHRLLAKGGPAVPKIAQAFPGVVFDGDVDRARLGARVFDDDAELRRLEAILHPMVRQEKIRFLQQARRRRHHMVALDIPLLFETGGRLRRSKSRPIIVVSCPAFLQELRVMARPGMTRGKLKAIRERQMADWKKRRHADFVVPTGLNLRVSLRKLSQIVRRLRNA